MFKPRVPKPRALKSKLPPSRLAPDPNTWLTFGTRLRELRQRAGLTQYDVERLAEIDVSYVSRLENGKQSPPSMEMLQKLSEVLGTSEEERDHLFALAGKIPPDAYRMLIDEPTLCQVVRAAARTSR